MYDLSLTRSIQRWEYEGGRLPQSHQENGSAERYKDRNSSFQYLDDADQHDEN
jgi:hypothetical protein